MINVKKGPAHSLLQTDNWGPVTSGLTVVAGMVVRKDTSTGTIKLGGASTDLMGFAANSSTDSDVLASGVIGFYVPDGGSVIETDQVSDSITSSNFPDGTPVYAQTGNTGLVTNANTVAKVLGYAMGIRSLNSQTVVINGVKVQGSITVLAIKLAV